MANVNVVGVVDRGMPPATPPGQVARLLWPTCVVAVALSASASAVGAVLLPETARVVHHSSGATWPKETAVVTFPAIVVGLVALALAARLIRHAGAALALAACAVFLAVWQVVAFVTAG